MSIFLQSYSKLILLYTSLLLVSCNNNTTTAKILVKPKAHNFKLGEVTLLKGPFKTSLDAEAKYLRSLELDRLIAPFRRESGLEMKKQPYPGWEGFLPGVALSFYMSGVSRLYAQTKDTVYIKNIDYILEELKVCQTQNNGYLLGSKNGKAVFSKLEEAGFYEEFSDWPAGHGTPYYVMEKLFSGLIDVYSICHKEDALKIAVKLADWLNLHMQNLSDNDMQGIMTVEYGGMNWVLSDLYKLTGNKIYFNMSKRWQDNDVVNPTIQQKNVLAGKHANTQFPKFSGLAARYPYSGNPADLNGAQYFWERVVNHHSYATGGNSESEHFSKPDRLAHTLTQFTEENCNVYNMLKLTSLLNRINPKVEYANFTERAMWNHLLAAQNTDDSRVCYYLPLLPGASREYQKLYESFSCCVCSAMDSYTRHAEYIYAHNDTDIFINQFIASNLHWEDKGFSLTQETNFPFEEQVTLKIKCDQPQNMRLKIRSPHWLADSITVKVNDKISPSTVSKGYINISRTWQPGDIVTFNLPMDIRFETMPDDANKTALFYGPILLSAVLDSDMATSLVEYETAPALVPNNLDFNQWLSKDHKALEFNTTVAQPENLKVKPFFSNKNGAYAVFWDKLNQTEWKNRLEKIETFEKQKQETEQLTIDKMIVGNEKHEAEHHLSGESHLAQGNKGIDTEKYWRVTTDSIGFGYKLNIGNHTNSKLRLRFLGPAHYETWDCQIKANNVIVDTLKREKGTSITSHVVLTYPLTNEITKGKDSVAIWFTSKAGWQMPRLIEIRTIRK